MSGHAALGFHALPHRPISRFGWRRDTPDIRDQMLRLTISGVQPAESNVFSKYNPPVYDQGQLGSCTGNGIACALQFERMRQNLSPNFIPSRLFVYYCERVIEGTITQDAGAEIRDGIKAVAKLGAPPEADWPYDISKFADRPSAQAYKDALANKALRYFRVTQTLPLMKACLISGYPIVFGLAVYESFESDQVANTGDVPMPQVNERMIGGHCMVVYGHDDQAGVFRFRNSWGTGWGDKGNGTIPYGYLTNAHLSSDFWTIRLVEAAKG